jgi:hypothetical protein
MKRTMLLFITGMLLILSALPSFRKKEKIIQLDLSKILNARPVTTFTNGRLITWTKGIDGNGKADGYLTMAAAIFKGDKDPKALPDNPLFTATNKHPEVLLYYSNNDSISNQAFAFSNKDSVHVELLPKYYTDLYLAFTSAEGASQIKVNLLYTDGMESKSFEVPDYYKDIPATHPDLCYLVHDLAKWGKVNNMTEKDHHNIDLLNIHPDPNRKLTGIKIEKAEAGYLLFWAATGVVK